MSEATFETTIQRGRVGRAERIILRWVLIPLGLLFFVFGWCVDAGFTAGPAGSVIRLFASVFYPPLGQSEMARWVPGVLFHLLVSLGQYRLWKFDSRLAILIGVLFSLVNIGTSIAGLHGVIRLADVDWAPPTVYAVDAIGGMAFALMPEPCIAFLMRAWRRVR